MFNPETETFIINVPVIFTVKDLDKAPATLAALKRKLADVAREEILTAINADILEYNRSKKA